jgi:hypothetical protein
MSRRIDHAYLVLRQLTGYLVELDIAGVYRRLGNRVAS